MGGIDTLRRMRKTNRTTKIIFLTVHADVVTASKAMAAGGSGYVLKETANGELHVALGHCCRGAAS